MRPFGDICCAWEQGADKGGLNIVVYLCMSSAIVVTTGMEIADLILVAER